MLEVVYSPRASYDIETISTYISVVLKNPQAADAWLDELDDAIHLLVNQPKLGRLFLDISINGPEYRTFLVGQYKLFYSSNEQALKIWRVLHSSQNLDDFALIDLYT